jgi:hypothetical protein
MAGTLWCLDALFAFSRAGASGFHFHWGFGGRPVDGGQPNTGVQTNFYDDDPTKPYPSVHAPWWAAGCLQRAGRSPRAGPARGGKAGRRRGARGEEGRRAGPAAAGPRAALPRARRAGRGLAVLRRTRAHKRPSVSPFRLPTTTAPGAA